MYTCDESKLSDIDAQSRILNLVLKEASRKIGRGEPVRLCYFSHVVDCCETTTSTHGLNHHGRLSGNMLGLGVWRKFCFRYRSGPPAAKLITKFKVLPW